MSAVLVLPLVWATAERMCVAAPHGRPRRVRDSELVFYRTYTEGMLRRYMKLSTEAGRVPSLLGRELFRGQVTNYRVSSFDDVVIFVHDMESCLAKLDEEQQRLVRRIGVQEYTLEEATGLLGMTLRTTIRRYEEALDRLTQILLEGKMLEPMEDCVGSGRGDEIGDSPKSCQEEEVVDYKLCY